jgi:hypothetical protein
MGRPPIGKVAMTAAERVRRHRLKHTVTKVTKHPEAADARKTEALEARIRELEAELARRDQRSPPPPTGDTAKLQARIKELEAELESEREQSESGWRAARRGIKFSYDGYRLLLSCLHPDSTVTPEKRERAFKIFTAQLPEKMFREKKPDPNKPVVNKPPPTLGPCSWQLSRGRARVV